MKALLINPSNKSVTEIEMESGIEAIYKAIGNNCETFACPIILDNQDTFYVDDEGLFHNINGGIIMKDWNYPIVGNIVVMGTNEDGESVDVKTDADTLTKQITWLSKEQAINYASNLLGTF